MLINEIFVDIDDLMSEVLDSEFVRNFTIVCDFNDAQRIIKRILLEGDMTPSSIELVSPFVDLYDKEYIITVTKDCDVFCERAFRDDKYLFFFDQFVFVLPSCSEEFRKEIDNMDIGTCFIVEFDEDDNDDCEHGDGKFSIVECKDGDRVGYMVKLERANGDGLEWYFDLEDLILEMIGLID